MSYHLYHTEGFVLGSGDVGEANKYFHLFTREFGMIVAHAQGIRLLASKLRGQSREFSCVDVSLIRGKRGWKITTLTEKHNLFEMLKGDRKRMLIVSQVFSLLRRLLRGEEKSEQLYVLVANSLAFLATETLDATELENLECATVLGILHSLGYVGEKAELQEFLVPSIDRALLARMAPLRSKALAEINRSLRESQL